MSRLNTSLGLTTFGRRHVVGTRAEGSAMTEAQQRANELIARANDLHAQGRHDKAVPLYLEAAGLFPPYASFGLVAADSLQEAGKLRGAADAYRAVVEAVPDHDQAWRGLGVVLHELGDHDGGRHAILQAQAIVSGLDPETERSLIRRYLDAGDMIERAEVAAVLASSLNDRVPGILYDFLKRASRQRASLDSSYWGAVATVLVRFGMADFVHWYSDGTAPDVDRIRGDVEKFLAANPYAPTDVADLWPVYGSPPPYRTRPAARSGLLGRLNVSSRRSA